MEKFNIVVCDDDKEFLEKLCSRVESIMQKNDYRYGITVFTDSVGFMEHCRKKLPDIILTDIDMPGKNGFDSVKELRENQPEAAVIFVSAHEELAYQSFYYNPYQFVSKADMGRLDYILPELARKIECRREQYDTVCIEAGKKNNESIIEINVNTALYLQKSKNYTAVYGKNGEILQRFRGTVTDVYNQIARYGFVHTNQSTLINCRFIKNFKRQKIILSDGTEIKNSRKASVIDEAQRLYDKFRRDRRW